MLIKERGAAVSLWWVVPNRHTMKQNLQQPLESKPKGREYLSQLDFPVITGLEWSIIQTRQHNQEPLLQSSCLLGSSSINSAGRGRGGRAPGGLVSYLSAGCSSWGRAQYHLPLCSRSAGSSGHLQAGTLLLSGGYGSPIFLPSKIFPHFAQAWNHEPPELGAQNIARANRHHCGKVPSMARSHQSGVPRA